jgi:putative Mn2+ efflux pump MntP
MDTKKGFLIIGIILIIISAISCIFGYRIREIWPTTNKIYEIGIPYIIGALGVIFLGISQIISQIKKKNNQQEKHLIFCH